MLKEFDSIPSKLTQTTNARRVRSWYVQSFSDLIDFPEEKLTKEAALMEFNDVLKKILQRHAPVVTTMALGILEIKENTREDFLSHYDFHTFLDRFYTSRIGLCEL
jgi:pyruvate dehydrogenase kinase 2/3/4